MKYTIGHALPNKNDASVKAHTDIDYFLKELNYQPLIFQTRMGTNKFSREIARFKSILKLAKLVTKQDTILMHYPVYSSKLDIDFFYKKVIVKAKLKIALIHDLPFLRDDNPPIQKKVEKEINRLNLFDVVIVHNASMQKVLDKYGLKTKTVNLEVFDYLPSTTKEHSSDIKRQQLNKVFFAGNLNKSSFVKKLKSDDLIEYNMWGSLNNKSNLDRSVAYHGVVSSDELPGQLHDGWGLVWDGDSLDAVTGLGGNYLKYIDPHKTSLYLVSGVPVIVWKNAGIADFIVENNLGIAVDSLTSVTESISTMPDDKLISILNSVENYQMKLQSGVMTKKAVRQAESYFNNMEDHNGN